MCRKASIAYTHRTQDTNRNEISFVDVLPFFISCVAALASRARLNSEIKRTEATKHFGVSVRSLGYGKKAHFVSQNRNSIYHHRVRRQQFYWLFIRWKMVIQSLKPFWLIISLVSTFSSWTLFFLFPIQPYRQAGYQKKKRRIDVLFKH